MITQGLLLWPYFTFARLIAPYVVAGKGREYREDWAALILLLVIVSTVVTVFYGRESSSPARRWLVLVALLIGIIGTYERLNSRWLIGVVRE